MLFYPQLFQNPDYAVIHKTYYFSPSNHELTMQVLNNFCICSILFFQIYKQKTWTFWQKHVYQLMRNQSRNYVRLKYFQIQKNFDDVIINHPIIMLQCFKTIEMENVSKISLRIMLNIQKKKSKMFDIFLFERFILIQKVFILLIYIVY